MTNLYPMSLIEDLQENNVVPFIGSGFSIPSGLPSWDAILEGLVENAENEYGITSFRQLFEDRTINSIDSPLLHQILANNKYPLRLFIMKWLGQAWSPNAYHEMLSRFPLDTIITTNYDYLIEKQYDELGISTHKIWRNEHLAYYNEKKSLQLIKIHGTIEDLNNIVIARDDYENYKRNFNLLYNFVETLFLTRTILFLGFSFRDPNILELLNEIKVTSGRFMRTHYAVMYKPTYEEVSKLGEYGIRVISLNENDRQASTITWLEGCLGRSSIEGRSNAEKSTMINNAIRKQIKQGVPGSVIRMRAALGILSNPKEVDPNDPVYSTPEQDRLENEMGWLAREFLNKNKKNIIRCIIHINPEEQLRKGYKKRHVEKRLIAIQEFLDEFRGQVELAHSSAVVGMNHVIVHDQTSLVAYKRGRIKGYDRIRTTTNRLIVRSEIENFDDDFDAIRFANMRWGESLGIDTSQSDWDLRLYKTILDTAIANLQSNGMVLECDSIGNPIGLRDRAVVHSQGILHKSVHLHVLRYVDGRADILFQRRSESKDLYAGMFDVAVAGHQEDFDPLKEILREAAEELGMWLDTTQVQQAFRYQRESGMDREIVDVFWVDATDRISQIGNNLSSEVDGVFWACMESVAESDTLIRLDGIVSSASMKFATSIHLPKDKFVPGLLDEVKRLIDTLAKDGYLRN